MEEENPTEQQYVIPPQPIAEEKNPDDDLSDLFEVDRDELTDTTDVVRVDMEKDILDADEDGTLDDLTTVTDEDIMGDELYGQSPLDTQAVQARKKKEQQVSKPVYRVAPPPPQQIGGLNT